MHDEKIQVVGRLNKRHVAAATGRLQSKPTWLFAFKAIDHVGFFLRGSETGLEMKAASSTRAGPKNLLHGVHMDILFAHIVPLAAIGYAFVYLLAGGGLGGAILIFIVAKMFGK